MRPASPDEEVKGTSGIAPGAITALLRDVFRLPDVERRDLIPEFRPGQVIGRFELVREIGRGGFGVVYEASDQQLRRAVALKAVRMGGDVELKEERLLREAEAAAQLCHPNIVTLFDVGSVDRGPYLVMELLRGSTLADRLRAGEMPVPEALRIALDVAKGVAHAHANGVIHRDLSPRNVFLCDDGHVKVLDFGMAQAFGHHKLDGGTMAYMAPEQYRREPEDERTDVFALGAILHEMLSGSVPFRDGRALASPDEAPRLQVPDPALADLVARMLAKDPYRRPRDGRDVLDALLASQEAMPGPAPARTAATPRVRKRVLLRVAPLALLVAASALLLVAAREHAMQAPDAVAGVPQAIASSPGGETASHAERAPAPGTAKTAGAVPDSDPTVGAKSPVRVAVPARARVRFCRDRINAVATPGVATGDGVLTIDADPYGDVVVNGTRYGETPRECQVSAGLYKVRLSHPRYGTREKRVEVSRGERARWTADFLGEP